MRKIRWKIKKRNKRRRRQRGRGEPLVLENKEAEERERDFERTTQKENRRKKTGDSLRGVPEKRKR